MYVNIATYDAGNAKKSVITSQYIEYKHEKYSKFSKKVNEKQQSNVKVTIHILLKFMHPSM